MLKACLHIVMTVKDPAGYLAAEQFISVGAVKAGVLELDAAISLWRNTPQTWMSLFQSTNDPHTTHHSPAACSSTGRTC